MEHGYLLFVCSFIIIISVLTAAIINYYYTENSSQDSLKNASFYHNEGLNDMRVSNYFFFFFGVNLP